jgi:hypothetical protein
MAKGAGSGDILARGGRKASYTTTEGGVSQKKWDDMFKDYEPEKFINGGNTDEKSSRNAGSKSGGSGVFETSRSKR